MSNSMALLHYTVPQDMDLFVCSKENGNTKIRKTSKYI